MRKNDKNDGLGENAQDLGLSISAETVSKPKAEWTKLKIWNQNMIFK